MTQPLAKPKPTQATSIEQALVDGDLSGLDDEARVSYYLHVCNSLGLNPYTKPFDYLRLNGKLVLYARRDCTDQLRKIHKISVMRLERQQLGELLVVTATATAPDGRSDSSIGAVATGGLKGESLANAMMRAETKAKRRVTLSLCGLGITDDTEVDSIPGAYRVNVESGEVETEQGFEPIKDAAPAEDRDLVRSADEQIWQNWLKVLARAQSVGLNPQQISLPMDRNDLREYGSQVLKDIMQREREAEAVGKR